ncbi:hypothetical protein C4J81_16550 [Deltaproteobacteria bacterium Smac51]|nr:hypothetical protein C4J81_16550 [Deltaproteobacteria bacterium Smac51]
MKSHATEKIDGVIVGGETGNNARPMHPNWVLAIFDQCREAQVSFFFKGWGEFSPDYDGKTRYLKDDYGTTYYGGIAHYTNCFSGDPMHGPVPMFKVGKKKSGRLLDGVQHNDLPWRPEAAK